ncbi:MAG TPA: flagellar hook-length control protein FliK [Chloroflexota bacterium]|jgi:hypothetical protein
MTTVNPIATVAAVPTPSVAGPETAAADGASFGAVLDQAIKASPAPARAAAPRPAVPSAAGAQAPRPAPPPASVPARPAGHAEATTGRVGPAAENGNAEAPVPSEETKPTPNLAEVALPIQALTSFLAAFIAMALQAAPSNAAAATSQTGGQGDGDGLTMAALGVSVTAGGQRGQAGDLAALARLGADGSAGSGQADLASPFADGAEAESGLGSIGQAFAQLMELGTASLDAAAQLAAGATSVDQPASLKNDASLGALVDALAELAARAGGSQESGAAVALAAIAQVGDGAATGSLPRTTTRLDTPSAALVEVARMVATLTRELSAAAGSVETAEGQTGAVEGAEPGLSAATAGTLVALADAAQAVRVGQVSGSSTVTVQLRPEALGKVTIEVERTAEGAVARVNAETAEAQRAIAGNVESVKKALAAIGVEVNRVEVSGPQTSGAAAAPAGFDAALDAAGTKAHADDVAAAAPSGRSEAGQAAADADEPRPEVEPSVDTATPAASAVTTRLASLDGAAAPSDAAPARAGVAQLVRDIASQAGLLLGQGKSEFQLQLRPEALGRLHLRMTLEGGEMTVYMRAESAAAKSAIESNLGQLKQSFQQQGIRVDRFEVVVQGAQGQLAQEQGHPRRSRGWVDPVRSRSNGRDEGDFAGALAAATRPVDFRA